MIYVAVQQLYHVDRETNKQTRKRTLLKTIPPLLRRW